MTWVHSYVTPDRKHTYCIYDAPTPEAVRRELLQPSERQTVCPWKGTASYYDVVVDGEVNRDAAWFYPEPKEAARSITGRIAFWKGVKVEP